MMGPQEAELVGGGDCGCEEREEPRGTPRSLIWRGGWMVVPFTEIGNKKQKKRERFMMAGSDLACWF